MCRKHHKSLGRALVKAAADIPLETERVVTAEWGLASRHRVAILSDIITNENLNLLQINYLAQKVDVLIFLLGRIVLVTELMARPSIRM